MSKYAICMTATGGWEEIVSAHLNGLHLYGNDVHLELLPMKMDPKWLAALPDYVHHYDWDSVEDPNKPANKGGGWGVRFYRYVHALKVKDEYDAVMICDADTFVMGNLMENFEKAAEGRLIAPHNPRGMDINHVSLEGIKGAASPSFHCHGFFFKPKGRMEPIIEEMYHYGLTEDYGDMATLFRTLLRNDMHKEVELINNDSYVATDWFFEKIVKGFDDQGRMTMSYRGNPMIVTHGRWWMQALHDKCKGTLSDRHKEAGFYNMECFREAIDWLNANGPIKWGAGLA